MDNVHCQSRASAVRRDTRIALIVVLPAALLGGLEAFNLSGDLLDMVFGSRPALLSPLGLGPDPWAWYRMPTRVALGAFALSTLLTPIGLQLPERVWRRASAIVLALLAGVVALLALYFLWHIEASPPAPEAQEGSLLAKAAASAVTTIRVVGAKSIVAAAAISLSASAIWRETKQTLFCGLASAAWLSAACLVVTQFICDSVLHFEAWGQYFDTSPFRLMTYAFNVASVIADLALAGLFARSFHRARRVDT